MQLARTAAFNRVLPVGRASRGARALVPRATPQDEYAHDTLGWRGPKPPSQAEDQLEATPKHVDEIRDTRGERTPSFLEVMAFNGTAPEIINGRLAMLGFVAAIAAEVATGQSVVQQWQMRPIPILLTFAVFIAASLYPFVRGKKVERVLESGPLTPTAEVINGRTAMIGFLALLATEWWKGGALIPWW